LIGGETGLVAGRGMMLTLELTLFEFDLITGLRPGLFF